MNQPETQATLLLELIALKNRFDENELAQSTAAMEAGKRLFLFNRQVELADAIRIVENKLKDLEHHGP
jgi:hypothetical protein